MQQNITIVYKKIKHINLKVKPNLEVILSVPIHTSKARIAQILDERKSWITKHLEDFESKRVVVEELQYNCGDMIDYLGHVYPLQIVFSNKNQVVFNDGEIVLYTKDINDILLKKQILYKWYLSQADTIFSQLVNKYCVLLNKQIAHLSIKKMQTRWGSCNTRKSYINLNIELIKKPLAAIEYVVVHELAHLTHANHSKSFYAYVANYMPDWQERKQLLSSK